MSNFNLKVEVSLSAETLQTVNAFIAALKGETTIVKMNGAVEKPIFTAKATEKPSGQKTAEAVVITLEQIRKVAAEKKAAKDGSAKLKALLDQFGAASVSKVPEGSYTEFYNALTTL